MANAVSTRSTAPRTAYVLTVVTGLGAAAAIGGVASVFYRDNPWMAFSVFAACGIGPMVALTWFVFVSKYTVEPDPHSEDNIESQWYNGAAAGAFHDLLIAGGLSLFVVSITQWDLSGQTALLLILLLMMFSFAVRYMVSKRRFA